MPSPRLHPKDGHPRHPWLEASHRIHPVDDALDDRRRRLATACYYGLCTWVDRQVGRVIGALERTGLSETTRVVYTSDHGDNIGARGMWGKSTHYDDAVGVPMIVAGPDVRARPASAAPPSAWWTWRLPSWRPSARTRTAWSKDLPGRSLLEIGSAPYDPARTVFSEYHAFASPSAAFMLRNGRFKYNYYVGYPPELFDLAADPGEERNLARTGEHARILAQFERQLRAMLDPEATDARAKADQADLIARFGGPEKACNVGAPGATPAPI